MESVKKNDFLATLVYNPDLTLSDLKLVDVTPSNSILLTKDEYKGMNSVQEAFKGDDGKFDETKFNTFYDNAKILYANYANDELFANIMTDKTYGSDRWDAPVDAEFRKTAPIIYLNKVPTNYSQGIKSLRERTDVDQRFSIRELAQREKIVDYETGEELDYSPNDMAGLFKRYTLPPAVIATYDEDDPNGQYKKGDLKFNKNGMPHYETLGNRDGYGKDFLRNSDILTVDGSKWNKFDFFDSDDIHKSAGKVAAKLVAKAIPLFIPNGVGLLYGILGAADGIIRSAPVLLKGLESAVIGEDNGKIGTTLTKINNYLTRFDSTASDYGRQKNLMSFEGVANMIGDVAAQLFQQRAISMVPAWIKKAETLEQTEEVAEKSRKLALAYMAATSSYYSYNEFKDAGASDRVAGLAMVANTLALYKLMNIDYFRNSLFKGTFLDESETKSAFKGLARDVSKKVNTATKVATPQEAKTLTAKLTKFYEETLVEGLNKGGFAGLVNRGFSEGVEETMEEGLADLIKGATEAANALGAKVTEPNRDLDFGWSTQDFIARYGTSFLGGFAGGMIFAGQEKYQKWLNNNLYGFKDLELNDRQKLVYLLAAGKRKDVDSYLEKWHKKGLLGSKDLSIDGSESVSLDGKSEFIPDPSGKLMSQNDVVYYTIKHQLDVLQASIESEVGKKLLTDEGIKQLTEMHYDGKMVQKNPKLIAASAISALHEYSNLENDLIQTLTDITRIKEELKTKTEIATTNGKTEEERKVAAENLKNDSEIVELQEQLKKAREKKDQILSGGANKYYAGQAVFSAFSRFNSAFQDLNVETFTKLKYGCTYNSLTPEKKAEVDADFNQYYGTEGKKRIHRMYDLYLDLSQKYSPVITQYGEKLDEKFKNFKTGNRIIGLDNIVNVDTYISELTKQKSDLEAEETPDVDRIKDVEEKIASLNKWKDAMQKNPHANFLHSFNDVTELLLNFADDQSEIVIPADNDTYAKGLPASSNPALEILNKLRHEYSENARTKDFRFDDVELNTFLRGLAKNELKSGNTIFKLNKYIEDLIEDYYDDDEFVASIEKDPDNRKWFTGIPTDTMNRFAEKIDKYIANLGIDHRVAQATLEEAKDILRADTKLLDNEEQLNRLFGYILPSLNGESIIDIIDEFDNYRQNITYSAFYDIAAQLGTDESVLNLLKAVQDESARLSNSANLTDYIINNPLVNSSLREEILKPQFDIIKALINGASNGLNDTINNFKIPDSANPMPIADLGVLSNDAANLLKKHSEDFTDKITLLRNISDANANRSLRKHKDTVIAMKPKWIKYILKNPNIGGIDVAEIWNRVSDGFDLSNVTEDNYLELNPKIIAFESELYKAFDEKYKDLSEEERIKTIGDLLLSTIDVTTAFKDPITKINENPESEINAIDGICYLASLLSIPADKFYQAYLSVLDNDYIPIYSQELAIRQCIAQVLNPELFNYLLRNIAANADVSKLDEDTRNYIKNKSVLENLSVVLGSAGTGKTMGIIVKTLQLLTNNAEIDVICSAKAENQATKLGKACGVTKTMTVDEIFQKFSGKSYTGTDHKFVNDTGHWTLNDIQPFTKTEFDNNAKLKILVIDEIQTQSEPKLSLLTSQLKEQGVRIIGLGDVKQPETAINSTDVNNNSYIGTSSILDCFFIRTPQLTRSMRVRTIAKAENTDLLNYALDSIEEEAQKDPNIDLGVRNTKIKEILASKSLYYYQDQNTGQVYGDMMVGTKESLLDTLAKTKKLVSKGEHKPILIITDNVGAYSSYVDDLVDVIDYGDLAGAEYEYVFVDVNIKDPKLGLNKNPYLLATAIYTFSQRSSKGSIMWLPTDFDLVKFESKPDKANLIEINNSEKKTFKEWTLKSFNGITPDEKALVDIFSNIKNVSPIPTSSGNTPTGGNPNPNPSPYGSNPLPSSGSSSPSGIQTGSTGRSPTPQVGSASNLNEFYGGLPIKTATNFLKILSEAFPACDFKSLFARTNSLPVEIFVRRGNSIQSDVIREIDKKYGEPGRKLYDGFVLRINGLERSTDANRFKTAIEDLSPIPTSGESRNGSLAESRNVREYSRVVNNKKLFDDVLNNEGFYSWNKEQDGKGIDSFKPITFANFTMQQTKAIYNLFGSAIRCGEFDEAIFNNVTLDIAIRAKIRAYNKEHKLWIVNFGNTNGLLVSRHYNSSGEYFDVPVCIVPNCTLRGEYIGEIKKINELKLKRAHGAHIPYDEFRRSHPELYFNKTIGVVNVNEADAGKVPSKSYAFVFGDPKRGIPGNNGKPIGTVTDEAIIYQKYFSAPGKNIYKNDGNYSISRYGWFDTFGIQCIADSDQFLELLEKYRELSGRNRNADDNIIPTRFTRSTQSTKSVGRSEVLNDLSLLRNSDGTFKQLLPKNRSGKLLAAAAITSKHTKFAISAFLNTKGDRIFEFIPMLVLSSGKFGTEDYREYRIAQIGNKYVTGQFDGKQFVPDGVHSFNGGVNVDFTSIFKELFGDEIPELHLHKYKIKATSKNNTPFEQMYAYNYELDTLLEGTTSEELKNAYRNVLEWKGIYLDDSATESGDPNSIYGVLNSGDRPYRIDIESIESYSQYSICPAPKYVKSSNPNPSPDPIPTKPTLQQFLRAHNLGNYNSVLEANNAFKAQSKDWRYNYIVETDDGFELHTYDRENFIPWLKDRFNIDIEGNISEDELNDISNSYYNENVTYANLNDGSVVYRYDFNNQMHFKRMSKNFDDMLDDLDPDYGYFFERIFNVFNEQNKFNEELKDLDFDTLEKIINFEKLLIEELGC